MARVRQTSLSAYLQIAQSGKLGEQTLKIYRLLSSASDGYTRNELSRILKIPINAVCGRCNELIKQGIAYEKDKRIDQFSKKENYILYVENGR